MSQSLRIPKRILVELFTRASSAASVVGHLDDAGDPHVERLADHLAAIVHELGRLLGARHLTVEPLPADEAPTRLATASLSIDELRQLMARADALASATDEQFCRVVIVSDGDDRRGFKRLAHLVELTAAAVMAASDASDRFIASIEHALSSERP